MNEFALLLELSRLSRLNFCLAGREVSLFKFKIILLVLFLYLLMFGRCKKWGPDGCSHCGQELSYTTVSMEEAVNTCRGTYFCNYDTCPCCPLKWFPQLPSLCGPLISSSIMLVCASIIAKMKP